MTGSASGAKPGKIRSPGINFLLYVVTFGIYGLVWHWKAGAEMDAFQEDANVGKPLRLYVILGAVASVILFIGGLMAFVPYLDLVMESEGSDLSDEQMEEFITQVLAALVIIAIGGIIQLVAAILHIIGMDRLWKTTAQAQTRIGRTPIAAGTMLFFLIFYYCSAIISGIPILGALVAVTALVFIIILFVNTQNAMNEVWRAYGAQG